MANNIIEVYFNGEKIAVTRGIYQYDYGMVLQFKDITLPESYEVHFAYADGPNSYLVLGDATGAAIPDTFLMKAKSLIAFVYLHEGEDDGETVYAVTIPVIARPRPTGATPTPVQHDLITDLIAAVSAAVDRAESIKITSSRYESLYGPGYVVVTLTVGTTASFFTIYDGAKGDKGDKGNTGDPGGVTSVNGQTGAVTLSIPSSASDVGAIASPATPTSGDFLVYNGSAWVAMSLSTWQGGSY